MLVDDAWGWLPWAVPRMPTIAQRPVRAAVFGVAALLSSWGCGESTPADARAGTCEAVIWARPRRAGTEVSVQGEWDGWNSTIALQRHGEPPWQYVRLRLPPGEYGYLLVEAGTAHVDPLVGLGGFRSGDELEVSWLVVDDCEQPRVRPRRDDDGRWRAELSAAQGGAPIERLELRIDGTVRDELAVVEAEPTIPLPPLDRGRHTLELVAIDADGARGPAAPAVHWQDPVAAQLDDAIIYQVLIDRFRGDDGAALAPPVDPGARAGGTLDGVRAMIEQGYFERFGVSTLWLSPVVVNPVDARVGRDDDHLYTGYHGYWPVDTRTVEPRIGGEAALTAVVELAHEHGLRVLLDLVPNHYDETNPRVAAHEAEGWFNTREPPCICGAPDCPWSSDIETCWFTPYLPDVRLQQRDALAFAIDDARQWVDRFGVDGFRVDAVPMMPRAATRRIYDGVRRAVGPREGTSFVGEVFTGAGAGGIAALRYHLGPDGLDSAFDFPTMWALRDVLRGDAGFEQLVTTMAAQDEALIGSGSVLARMLGNHDTTRFVTALAGDEDADAWTAPAPEVLAPEVLARVRLGFVLLFTLPGMPVLYYGDELALAGAADPDNRRVMPDDADVAPEPMALREVVAALGRLRRCAITLRRGGWRSLGATADQLAFVRELAGQDDVLVVVSRADAASALSVPAAVEPGWYKDAMSGERFEVGAGGVTLELPAFGARVLLPESHACL